MDSRSILRGSPKRIQVHLDSETFEDLLNREDRLATSILKHNDSEYLEFVRSPLGTSHDQLEAIPEYELKLDDKSEIRSVEISGIRMMAFGYRMDDIRSVAREILSKKEISKNELKAITMVFIQAIFNRFEKSNIYITSDKTLLENRRWFESHFPGGPLNIFSVGERARC